VTRLPIDFTNSYPLITWDLNKRNLHINYFGKKYDTARGFKVQILQNSDILIPTVEKLRLYCEKPDKTRVWLDATISNNLFHLKLTNEIFATKGDVYCELQLSYNGEWLFSDTFVIKAEDSLLDGSIASNNQFIVLLNALNKVESLESTYSTRLTSIENQFQQLQNNFNSAVGAVTADSEVILARTSNAKGKTFDVLDDRLEELDESVLSLESMTNLALIDTQTGSFVQSTVADDCVAEVVIEGKTVVTPLDPTQDISPDNPATIESVGDVAFDVVSYGKNLAYNVKYLSSNQFISSVCAEIDNLLPDTKYTISLIVPNGESFYINEYIFVEHRTINGNGTRRSIVVTTKSNISRSNSSQYNSGYKGWILFKNSSGYSSSGTASGLQVELGEIATPYEPYKGSNKITISSPLRNIPDSNTLGDTLEIFTNKTAKYTRRVKRAVITGSSDIMFVVEQGANNIRFQVQLESYNTSNASSVTIMLPAMSDKLEVMNVESLSLLTANTFNVRQHRDWGGIRATICIPKNYLSSYDVEGVKTWLNSNPITILYYFVTSINPAIEEIVPFDSVLMSYKGITNILTTASIQPNITAKFYSRLNNAVDVLRGMPATNLITNGDFRYGTAGWYTVGVTGFTALNNEATFTITSQYGRIYSSVPLTGSRKIYFAGLIKTLSNDVRLVVGTDAIVNATGKAYGRSGDYERLSLVYTSPTTMTNFYYGIADYSNSNWKPINVKYLIALDLTETFGAGNEPSAADMDVILSKFPNGWFNGTVNPLMTPKEIFNYFNNKYVALKNAIIAMGGTV